MSSRIPRKIQSCWSRLNVAWAARNPLAGHMRPAGRVFVTSALIIACLLRFMFFHLSLVVLLLCCCILFCCCSDVTVWFFYWNKASFKYFSVAVADRSLQDHVFPQQNSLQLWNVLPSFGLSLSARTCNVNPVPVITRFSYRLLPSSWSLQ